MLNEERASRPAPGSSSAAGAIYDQHDGELPDDFKVSFKIGYSGKKSLTYDKYGVTVSESSAEIRNAFVRKVYSILCKLRMASILSRSSFRIISLPDCKQKPVHSRYSA